MRAASPISVAQADPYVRRVAGVCDMHRVAMGSPAELQGFLTALDQDKHLAMDFWAIMGKMSDEGPVYLAGRTLNARMLEVVVEAVTGASVAEILASGEQPRQVMAQLVRLLAGEDIHSPVVVDDPGGDDSAGIAGGDEALRKGEAEAPDVESRKPMARAESSAPSAAAGPVPGVAGSASPLRPFRNGAGEVERLPVELRPLHRAPDEAAASVGAADEADSGQANAGATPRAVNRDSVKRTTIRWPYEPAVPEPFAQPPPSAQQPSVPEREASRSAGPPPPGPQLSGPQFGTTRAAFVQDAPPTIDNMALSDAERLERLRLVHWVLENFPATQGSAAVRAEADYYGAKLSAAEIFARYAEYRSRAPEAVVERPTAAGRVEERRVEERSAEGNRADGVWEAKPFWRTPEGSVDLTVDPSAPLKLPQTAEILSGRARDVRAMEDVDDASIRVPLSNWEDDEEEADLQRRAFAVVLSVIVAVGILVGVLMAQIHVVDGWRSLRGSISDRLDALTHRDRSALDIPNDLVVDPPRPAVEPPPVRRAVHPPQARAAAPVVRYGADQPLVRILPAPIDRIDPVPGASAGVVYDTVLTSGGAGSRGGPISVPGSVMEANLLLSRTPAYPEGAKDGRVVLQAIISKNGSVGHLRVLSGDSVLRGLAADAVAKWRYRPYLVNNEPAEVTTTVTVDFSRSR